MKERVCRGPTLCAGGCCFRFDPLLDQDHTVAQVIQTSVCAAVEKDNPDSVLLAIPAAASTVALAVADASLGVAVAIEEAVALGILLVIAHA